MRTIYYLPLYFFVAIALLMAIKFFNTSNLKSPLIGMQIKDFSLASSMYPKQVFSTQQLKGQLSIINFFASWCNYCRIEHDFLVSLSSTNTIPIYGIAIRENPSRLKQFLISYDNPYKDVGNDSLGQLAVEFGIIGFPETILVNKEGIIIYHIRGALTKALYDQEILPIIKKELKQDI
ncbi:MAG: redoxin family protein [Rickettsiales endosymbiont of Dermacentor nuttalli]